MEENSSSQDPVGHPVSALLGAECATIVRAIVATEIDLEQLNYDAVNILHSRGSLPRELRRAAVVSIRTLQAIVRDANRIMADGPLEGQAQARAPE